MFFIDPLWLIIVSPALLLGIWAQYRVRSAFAAAERQPAPLSGAAAARHILNSAGLQNVEIEPVQGYLSDHYDPRHKVLRLSPGVYQSRSMAAVGIAAHEAGHAIQDAANYAPLVIRNAVVPVAGFGSGFGIILVFIGAILSGMSGTGIGYYLIWGGIGLFATVVFFQLVNLPVEFDASARAKAQLVEHGIVGHYEMGPVNKVLNAAALTYVAATLQAVLTLLYLLLRFTGGRD